MNRLSKQLNQREAREIRLDITDTLRNLITSEVRSKRTLILLCGSLARGDFVPNWSDIDLVAMEEKSEQTALNTLFSNAFASDINVSIGIRFLPKEILCVTDSKKFKLELRDWVELPFGAAKALDALYMAGRDTLILHGDHIPLCLTNEERRFVYLSGVRDTINVLASNPIDSSIDDASTMKDRRRIGQVVNLCRNIIRLSGSDVTLNYMNLTSTVCRLDQFPGCTKTFIRRVYNLRQQVSTASEEWRLNLKQLSIGAENIYNETANAFKLL